MLVLYRGEETGAFFQMSIRVLKINLVLADVEVLFDNIWSILAKLSASEYHTVKYPFTF